MLVGPHWTENSSEFDSLKIKSIFGTEKMGKYKGLKNVTKVAG